MILASRCARVPALALQSEARMMRSKASLLDRLLRPLSKVHAGEGAVAALMLVCVFLILTATTC